MRSVRTGRVSPIRVTVEGSPREPAAPLPGDPPDGPFTYRRDGETWPPTSAPGRACAARRALLPRRRASKRPRPVRSAGPGALYTIRMPAVKARHCPACLIAAPDFSAPRGFHLQIEYPTPAEPSRCRNRRHAVAAFEIATAVSSTTNGQAISPANPVDQKRRPGRLGLWTAAPLRKVAAWISRCPSSTRAPRPPPCGQTGSVPARG